MRTMIHLPFLSGVLLPFLLLLVGQMHTTVVSADSQLGESTDNNVLVVKRGLSPRQGPSSTPCPYQRYVCPEPRPYPGVPDTGAIPPEGQFKCRIGTSSSDPDFAFCYYNKNTGALVSSTPPGIQALCWESGMPNPECNNLKRQRRQALPKRVPNPEALAAPQVEMAQFGTSGHVDLVTKKKNKREPASVIIERLKLEGRMPLDAELAHLDWE